MNLIIVESPTKARTLTRFLKGKYAVEASVGHIRDLPKSDLGVEIENNFTPKYVIPADKRKRVSELKELAAKADEIILATDPDREGEAIAWHIAAILQDRLRRTSNVERRKTKKKDSNESDETKVNAFKRIVFHEITESAIAAAIANPQTIEFCSLMQPQYRQPWEQELLRGITKKILRINPLNLPYYLPTDTNLPNILKDAHIPSVILRLGFIRDYHKDSAHPAVPVADLFFPRGWQPWYALNRLQCHLSPVHSPPVTTHGYHHQVFMSDQRQGVLFEMNN